MKVLPGAIFLWQSTLQTHLPLYHLYWWNRICFLHWTNHFTIPRTFVAMTFLSPLADAAVVKLPGPHPVWCRDLFWQRWGQGWWASGGTGAAQGSLGSALHSYYLSNSIAVLIQLLIAIPFNMPWYLVGWIPHPYSFSSERKCLVRSSFFQYWFTISISSSSEKSSWELTRNSVHRLIWKKFIPIKYWVLLALKSFSIYSDLLYPSIQVWLISLWRFYIFLLGLFLGTF